MFSFSRIVRPRWSLLVLVVAFPALSSGSPPARGKRVIKQMTIEAENCHGANRFNDEQVALWTDLRASWGPEVPQVTRDFWNAPYAFREVGVQGTSGAEGINENTPLDSIMASYLAPETLAFIVAAGWQVADGPDVLNRPIHDPQTWVNNSLDRGPLPAANPSLPKYVSVRNTVEPVTLRQWNAARGSARFTCYDDGTGHVVFDGRDMLPLRPYTFWAIHAATQPESLAAFGGPLLFWMVGGLPGATVADNKGRVRFERDLHYCPLELDDPFMYMAVYPHWDGSVWGNQSSTYQFDGFGAGNAAAVQMCVPVGDHLLDR